MVVYLDENCTALAKYEEEEEPGHSDIVCCQSGWYLLKHAVLSTAWYCLTCYLAGENSDVEAADQDFALGNERLEDDEELKLHVLGLQSCWTQLLG